MIPMSLARDFLTITADREALASLFIEATIELLEQQTARLWKYRTSHVTVENIDLPGRTYVWAPLFPLASVSLREWSKLDTAPIEVPTTDYQVDMRRGRITRLRQADWLQFLEITMTGGYTEETCPQGARLAVLTQAKYTMQRTSDASIAVRYQAMRGGSVGFAAEEMHPLFRAYCESERVDHGF